MAMAAMTTNFVVNTFATMAQFLSRALSVAQPRMFSASATDPERYMKILVWLARSDTKTGCVAIAQSGWGTGP
jgi:hypothetical protein